MTWNLKEETRGNKDGGQIKLRLRLQLHKSRVSSLHIQTFVPLTICLAHWSYTCSCDVLGGSTRSNTYGLLCYKTTKVRHVNNTTNNSLTFYLFLFWTVLDFIFRKQHKITSDQNGNITSCQQGKTALQLRKHHIMYTKISISVNVKMFFFFFKI